MKIYDAPALAAAAVAARADRPATALIHDVADARVLLFRLDPGQEVPAHTSASTVLLTVISGVGIVIGADGERRVKQGDLVAFGENEPHGMKATEERFVIAAVIAPRPATR